LSDELIRRLALKTRGSFTELVDIAIAVGLPYASEVEASVSRLREAGDLDDLGPELTGEEVMRLLDVGPGPWVGEVLAELSEYRLAGGRHDPADLEAKVRTYWASRPVR
jgi:hypothetical protein